MAHRTSAPLSSRSRARAALAAVAALALAAAILLPVSVDGNGLSDNAAAARGGGGGGGGGGNGNGGGHGGDHGKGHGDNRDKGQQVRATGANSPGSGKKTTYNAAPPPPAATQAAGTAGSGQLTARLGSLNAAHASPQAFEKTSTNSVIGALRDYMDSLIAFVTGGDPLDARDAADALQRAANKESLIDPAVIDAVNELLDGKRNGFTHEAVAGDPIHESEDDVDFMINQAP